MRQQLSVELIHLGYSATDRNGHKIDKKNASLPKLLALILSSYTDELSSAFTNMYCAVASPAMGHWDTCPFRLQNLTANYPSIV